MSNSVKTFAICFDKKSENLFGQPVTLPGTLIVRGDITATGPLTTYQAHTPATPGHVLKLSVCFYAAAFNIYLEIPNLSPIPYFNNAPFDYTDNPSIGMVLSSVLFGLAFNYDNGLQISMANRLALIGAINETVEKLALDMPHLNSSNGGKTPMLDNCDYNPTTWYHVLEREYKGYQVWCKRRNYNGDVASRWTFMKDIVGAGGSMIEQKYTIKDQVRFGEQPKIFADVCKLMDAM